MAHYQEVSVSGFEDFSRAVELHKGKTIFAYFTGSKDAEGKSWCPDCVQGEAGIRGLPPRGNDGKAEATAESGVGERQRESCPRRSAGRSELSSCLLLLPCSLLSCCEVLPRPKCSSYHSIHIILESSPLKLFTSQYD